MLIPALWRSLGPEVDLLRPGLVIGPQPGGEALHQGAHNEAQVRLSSSTLLGFNQGALYLILSENIKMEKLLLVT